MRKFIIAAAAAASLLGFGLSGASAATLPHHVTPKATPSCGSYCVNLFSQQAGPLYIPSTAGSYSSRVFIQHASNTAKSEDFRAYEAGTLDQFVDAGLIAKQSYAALNYSGDFPVFEIQYAPYGVDSGLCAAVKGSAREGKGVLLRDCGKAARSLWVGDLNNQVSDSNSSLGFDVPLVNASDRSFSRALVLTYNGVGAQLTVQELRFDVGTVADSQEWGLTPVS